MIISASRRTDIPAFYSEWFFNRLKAGFVKVRNPLNPNQIREIILNPLAVDCFVFWTKNPAPMISNLDLLNEYPYYFLFTLTSYGKTLEKNTPETEFLIETFQKLSNRIGKLRVLWRYDPIIITSEFDQSFHLKNFKNLTHRLQNSTGKCIISFITMYQKCIRNLSDIQIIEYPLEQKTELLTKFSEIAIEAGISLELCADDTEYHVNGILRSRCVDERLIQQISGNQFFYRKDKNQRKACGCVESADIGTYNTCLHHCLYCYANNNFARAIENAGKHDPHHEILY